MGTKKYVVRLATEERKKFEGITKRGKYSATTVKRANTLLDLEENCGLVRYQAEIAPQIECVNSHHL